MKYNLNSGRNSECSNPYSKTMPINPIWPWCWWKKVQITAININQRCIYTEAAVQTPNWISRRDNYQSAERRGDAGRERERSRKPQDQTVGLMRTWREFGGDFVFTTCELWIQGSRFSIVNLSCAYVVKLPWAYMLSNLCTYTTKDSLSYYYSWRRF